MSSIHLNLTVTFSLSSFIQLLYKFDSCSLFGGGNGVDCTATAAAMLEFVLVLSLNYL